MEQSPQVERPHTAKDKGAWKWRRTLTNEISFRQQFDALSRDECLTLVQHSTLTSSNHDTVVSLDWPHYCGGATEGCGGPSGWCYTFGGHQASVAHVRKVAMVDSLARTVPEAFAEKVVQEVTSLVLRNKLPYPNLRYSGSGELAPAHIPALEWIGKAGVKLWGFTRLPRVARRLLDIGAAVIFSIDSTSPKGVAEWASREGIPLAYTSLSVADLPPSGTLVTFPLHHRRGVAEVVDDVSVCPKVEAEYLYGKRDPGMCQWSCNRCHSPQL